MKETEFDLIKKDFENLLKTATNDEKIGILYAIMSGEFKFVFEDYANEFITNSGNVFINAHYISDFCISETYNFLLDVIEQHCIDKSRMDYFKKVREKWDKRFIEIDNSFRKTVGKFDPDNIPIKKFPANTAKEEKEILNHLAKEYHIQRELSPDNKFPLFTKAGTKRLIKALYEYAPDYKDFRAFNFIHSLIEINLPDATLQNYCREIKKDMPLNKQQNV